MSTVKVLVELDKRDYDVYIRQPIGTLQVALSRGTVITDDCISRSALKTELEVYRHTRNYKSDEDEAQNNLLDNILEDIDNAPSVVRPDDYDKYGDVVSNSVKECNTCIHNGKRSVTGKCDMCEDYSQWQLDYKGE